MVKRSKGRVLVDSDEDEDSHNSSNEGVKRPKVVTEQEEGEVEEESSSAEEEEEAEEEESEDEGSNGDDEMEPDDDGKFPDGLDANLMGDADDQARLQAMSEKEREQELYERLEKREALKTRLKIERNLKKGKKKKGAKDKSNEKGSVTAEDYSPPASPLGEFEDESGVRAKRVVESSAKSIKLNAIQRLRDERERKKQNAEAQRQQREQKHLEAQKRRNAVSDDEDGNTANDDRRSEKESSGKIKPSDIYSSDDDDDDDVDQASEYKFKPREKSDSSSVSSNLDSSSSSSSDSDKDGKDSDDDLKTSSKPIETKDDLMRIRLSRHKLAKWCHAPFFEEAVKGSFVRVNLGQGPHGVPTYRVAEVVGVVETAKVYNTEGVTTNKGLKLRYCKWDRMYRLEFISNQPISDTEFTRWYSEMQSNNLPLPLIDDVLKKQRQLTNFANHNYTEQDVDAIVQEKSKFRHTPRNYAMKKTDLMKEKLEAEAEGDIERVHRVQNQLNEIEERAEMLDKQRTRNISAVTYINNRNKSHNLKQAEIAMMMEYREMKNKEGEDPFTRRKSRPTLVTKAHGGGVIDQKLLEELKQKSVEHLKVKSEENAVPPSATPDNSALTTPSRVGSTADSVDSVPSRQSTTLLKSASANILSGLPSIETPPPPLGGASRKEDLFSVHNFDINIDLFSTTSSNSSFSKTSSQDWPSLGVESTGAVVPRRSLNLEQYKKEKGLI